MRATARAGHLRSATSSSWTEVGEGVAGWARQPRGSRLGRQRSQRGTSGVQGTVGLQGRGCREQKGSLDRSFADMDYVTALCSQVVYEGLVDDTFRIKCGRLLGVCQHGQSQGP